KGAAQRIRRVAAALFAEMGGGALYVLGDAGLPPYQREGEIEIVRFREPLPNFLDRALAYGDRLAALLDEQAPSLELCQFRDPWAGVPIVAHPRRRWLAIYEINGLPSIELPARYRGLPRPTIAKLRDAEAFCWSLADLVLTPSRTLRDNLIRLGVPAGKIEVSPNGADLHPPSLRPAAAPARYLLYVGALQPWQGIDVLLRAFALLRDDPDLHLALCASAPTRAAKAYAKLAEKLGVAERVVWRFGLPESELAPWLAHAELSVAPLTACPRNLEQGCFPLKILESMAAGVPVVASDLPAVRELIDDRVDGRLTRAGRPSELARTLRVLLEEREERRAMGERARQKVEQHYTWTSLGERLRGVYRAALAGAARPELRSAAGGRS
ncbi:MAG TPA: glycosyltransferase, partial [Thermoanaerobaculia bacterium]